MAIELVPLCTLDITLSDPISVGDGPSGSRFIYEVVSATIDGERIKGKGHGRASADWVTLIGTVATLDVRATFETDDGAIVLVQYRGRTDLAEGTIYVAPLFETGDPRYAWLNAIQAVGKGKLDGTHLTYEWHEVR
jgi:hypothetical protein